MFLNNIFLTILAVIPGVLICYFIYRYDKFETESRLPLAICFALGIVCALPALKLEEWGDRAGIDENQGFWMLMLLSYVVIALSEELMKYIVLVAYPFQKKFFNEPLDGIVYAVMIGMGFATIENIIYANRFGTGTTIVRAFTAVPAHAVFAVAMGYFAGIAKIDPKHRYRNLALSLLVAVLIHGTYDLFILQQYYEWLMIFATVTLLASGYVAYHLIRQHRENSPFEVKEATTDVEVKASTPPADKTSIDPIAQTDDDIMDAIMDDLDDD